jgi:hypothetical protein
MEQQRRQLEKQGSLPEARRLEHLQWPVQVANALDVTSTAGKELIGALLSQAKPYSWKLLMERVHVKALERILYVDANDWKGDMTRKDTFDQFHKDIKEIDEAINTSRIQTLRKILSTMGGREVPWYKFIW